mgnify:CR=1 FL=1
MLILGISTTTKTGSVALFDDKKGLLGEITVDIEKTHSGTLLDKIDKLLEWTSKKISDIDEVAVSNGPGSFTGVRIAIATVKGLFFVKKIPVYPVNELDALAYQVNMPGEKVVSVIDSRKEKIYYSISRIEKDGLKLLEGYHVAKLDDLLEKLHAENCDYYFSGDGAIKDEDGYIFITGRVDDVINVAGHRLSTSEMEEVVSSHPDIAECAVVGIDDQLKGQIPFATIVLKNGSEISDADIEKEIVLKVREKIGAVACLKNVMVVKRLPKTRSGKILRKLLRTMLDGKEFQIPSTIDDEKIVEEIDIKINEYRN